MLIRDNLYLELSKVTMGVMDRGELSVLQSDRERLELELGARNGELQQLAVARELQLTRQLREAKLSNEALAAMAEENRRLSLEVAIKEQCLKQLIIERADVEGRSGQNDALDQTFSLVPSFSPVQEATLRLMECVGRELSTRHETDQVLH